MKQAEGTDNPPVEAAEIPVSLGFFDSCTGVERLVDPVYRVKLRVQIDLLARTSANEPVVVDVIFSLGLQRSESHGWSEF